MRLLRHCVNIGHHFGHSGVLLVVIHEQPACFLVQTAFGEGNDEKAPDDAENVAERPLGWIPVSFQSIYTNIAFNCYVRVEDLGQEVALRGRPGELRVNFQRSSEYPSLIRRVDYTESLESLKFRRNSTQKNAYPGLRCRL